MFATLAALAVLFLFHHFWNPISPDLSGFIHFQSIRSLWTSRSRSWGLKFTSTINHSPSIHHPFPVAKSPSHRGQMFFLRQFYFQNRQVSRVEPIQQCHREFSPGDFNTMNNTHCYWESTPSFCLSFEMKPIPT